MVTLARVLFTSYSLGCGPFRLSLYLLFRSDREFLYDILGEVIKAGATTLNIPDTVGYTIPSEFGQLIADIKTNTPGIENVIISTHCQNDLGLATANTLAVSVQFLPCLKWLCMKNIEALSNFRELVQVQDN